MAESALEKKNRHFQGLFDNSNIKWLGQNTNHLPTPATVKKALQDAIEREIYHAYAPPAGLEELRSLIRHDLGLEDASVFVTDGAIEALYHACRTLCGVGDEFITTDPGWAWPKRFAEASGARVIELPIYEAEQGYRLAPEQLAASITSKTRIIYLVDPNNPLGICYPREDIEAFARIASKSGAYVIHDCTYRHFADDHHLMHPFYPERTLTTYSFSKWLGLAGLRVGAILANPALIEQLAKAPPNNLGSNVLGQIAAIAGLRIKDEWFPELQELQRANQNLIFEAVSRLDGLAIPVFPSDGNFVAIDVFETGIRPEALSAEFLKHDILIRQAAYHTERYANRFVKVSTTVPRGWIEEFCERLPACVERAAGQNEWPSLF